VATVAALALLAGCSATVRSFLLPFPADGGAPALPGELNDQ
jgi:hypothetical protein